MQGPHMISDKTAFTQRAECCGGAAVWMIDSKKVCEQHASEAVRQMVQDDAKRKQSDKRTKTERKLDF